MEFDEIVVKDTPGLCRCCLSEGCYKDLSTEYPWMDDTEIYADMLLECFDVSISQHIEGPNGPNRLICEVCITRLRDACNFKKQVLDSEKKFIDMVGRGAFKTKVLLYPEQMKSESQEVAADEAEIEYLDEDVDYDDIPLNELATPSVSEDITVATLPVAKRGRPKKTMKNEKKKIDVKLKTKSKGVYSTIGNRRSMFSQIPLVTEESWQKHQLVTRMAYTDFELEFTFDFQTDRWIVESVALLEGGEEVGRTPLRAGAPWSWSYTCSEPLVLVNLRDGSALTISHYQIQPFKNNYLKKDDEGGVGGDDNLDDDPLSDPPGGGGGGGGGSSSNSTKFGKSINCGPYFNAPILAGLMVTAFCISILTYGVVSMYNLRANDRYDDQHGKPLVIAAEAGH
nr:uncharacterized protein LOC116776970 isoform X13 [Danaus plexippus plexippus]